MYAKIEYGELVSAPRVLWRKNSFPIFNPTAEDYKVAGYLPVTFNKAPNHDSGYCAIYEWTQTPGRLGGAVCRNRVTRKAPSFGVVFFKI